MEPEFEIVTVTSGARSVRSREFRQVFHPVVGPMEEARGMHARGSRVGERAAACEGAFVVWDVGLGAAANAVAVLEECAAHRVEMHSFDRTLAPLAFAFEHSEELGYLAPFHAAIESLLATGRAQVGGVEWIFHAGEFADSLATAPPPHAILYDPYSPGANREMWTLEHFTRLQARLEPARPCLLTSYTRSTAMRVTMLLAGFFVGRGHATGEKDETTIAANDVALLDEPLDAAWLARVVRSTASAPLREEGGGGAIGPDDLARLHAHRQFA